MSTPLRTPPDGRRLLTVAETDAALGARHRTILVHLERGRFPGAFKHPGGQWRIPAADVHAARVALGITDDGAGGS